MSLPNNLPDDYTYVGVGEGQFRVKEIDTEESALVRTWFLLYRIWLITASDLIGLHQTTSDHVWPCLHTRDRNFKSEAEKRWNYLQNEQATRHAVSSQVRPPQKHY